MKTLKSTFFLACTMVVIGGCLDQTGPEPTVITDPSATSHLYITNQSDLDLSITYKTTDSYGGIDNTVAVSAGSTIRILSREVSASLLLLKP